MELVYLICVRILGDKINRISTTEKTVTSGIPLLPLFLFWGGKEGNGTHENCRRETSAVTEHLPLRPSSRQLPLDATALWELPPFLLH